MGSCQPFWNEDDDSAFACGLHVCEWLLAEHLAGITRLYGNYGLGLVELPDLSTPGSMVPTQIMAGATLYWCSEIDKGGILIFVEALAEKLLSGQLSLPIQTSASLLRPFWRSAQHRFTEPERTTLYRQVLDNGVPNLFTQQLHDLASVLIDIGREPNQNSVLHLQTKAAQHIHNLAQGLSDRSVGITGFAARDIVKQIRHASAVLKDPEIIGVLGGGNLAFILQRWSPQLLGRTLNLSPHLRLAQHGVALLHWVAQEAPSILSNSHLLHRQHPLIREAEAWLAIYSGIRGG